MDATFSSRSAAFRGGLRQALGVPAAVLGAGFIGYGALAAEHGHSIAQIVFATCLIWALPGQLVMVEMNAMGASVVAIVAAAGLTSARFLPMAVTVTPVLRDRRYGPAALYPAIQLLSMTTWALTMQHGPRLAPEQRVPYFVGLGLACIVPSAACGAAGHLLAGTLPPLVRLGFVFLTPVYFLVILIGDVRTQLAAVALACGAVAGPLFHWLTPEWSVVLAGFVGGTLAYFIQRAHGRRTA